MPWNNFVLYATFLIFIQTAGSRQPNFLQMNEIEHYKTRLLSPASDQVHETSYNISDSRNHIQMSSNASSSRVSKNLMSNDWRSKWDADKRSLQSKYSALKTSKRHTLIGSSKSDNRQSKRDMPRIQKFRPIINQDLSIQKHKSKAQPRVLMMTTIGIINGFIAAGAGLSMGAVMLTGLLVMIKMAIAALFVTMGWIYII